MPDVNLNEMIVTNEEFMEVMHEIIFNEYEDQLRKIQKMTGASNEDTDAAIKECDEKMKQAFFDAGNKLDPSR